MKGKLKAMFTRNIGMKLVSIAVAFIVWVTIINFSDPKVTRTLSGIPIEQRNEDLVNAENKTYVSDSPKTVSIRIYGVRSKIQDITADDFTAYIDFREMSNVNAVPVHVEPKDAKTGEYVEITKQSMTMVTGKIEETEEDLRVVEVRISGVPDHYYAHCTYQSTKSLKIYGSKNDIKSIALLVANVNLNESAKSISQMEVPLTALDRNGKKIDLTDVKIPIASILVDIAVLPVQDKEIVLDTGNITAAKGFGIADVDYTATVPLAADLATLDIISKIVVPYTARDLMESVEDNSVSIINLLPSGVYVAAESNAISVKITVERLGQKPFTVRTSTISVRNLADTLKAEFTEETTAFSVYDLNAKLVTITEADLGLYVDLSEVRSVGEVSVELHSTQPSVESSLREDDVHVPIKVAATVDNQGGGDSE
jgi:YbbR-like protein.